MSRDRKSENEKELKGLDSFLRESLLFRDLVEDKGIEWVKKDLKEHLLKATEVLQSAYAMPRITKELKQELDDAKEYAYEKAFGVKVAKARQAQSKERASLRRGITSLREKALRGLEGIIPEPVPMLWPQGVFASGAADAAVVLEGTPAGLRAELRWPRPNVRNVAQLVIVLSDWDAFRLEKNKSAHVGLKVLRKSRANVPWDTWMSKGEWTGIIQPGQREIAVPITLPKFPADRRQRDALQRWIRGGGLGLLPPWQPPEETT